MSQVAIELIIGCVTFFITSLTNAVIIGIFVGGVKSDLRNLSERFARIEGAFQLVPNTITITRKEE
jgi:hypothetical protein